MNWVSIKEAAELEKITYNACKIRFSNNQYIAKREPNPQGGHDLVYIEVSSLSREAQDRYKRKIRSGILRQRKERMIAEGEPPWYVGYDIGQYMDKYSEVFMQATNTLNVIKQYIHETPYHKGRATEFMKEFCRDNFGKSDKQFYRLLQRYKEACMWAEICESEDGKNHDYFMVLALCPQPKAGKAVSMTNEILADIENLWADRSHHENLQSVQMLYDNLVDILKQRGSDYIPAYNTVRRYIKALEGENADVRSYLKGGAAEFKHNAMHKGIRDNKELHVMEFVQADAHTFDCWIKYARPNGTVTAIRPYLVGFMDTRSRALVGWGICAQPNSEVIEQVVLHMIYKKKDSPFSGVPRVLLLDNGKDFTAKTLTGRSRKERFDLSNNTKGFYKSIGIEYEKRALPYQPWTKAQIERYFGTVCSRFSKKFPSYTGTLTGSKTDAKVKKDIEGMLARDELPDMEAFASMFEVWLEEDYHHKIHEGLKKQKEEKPTPYDVFISAERYTKAAPPIEYAISMLGAKVIRLVKNYGIDVNGMEYFNEELSRYVGEKIIVRYTKYDDEYVCCQTLEGEKICTAYKLQKLSPLAEHEDDRLIEHIKTQRRQLKRVKDDIDKLSIPYVQRELVVPELCDIPDKVVSIPQDNNYRDRVKAIYNENKNKSDEKKKQKQELNDFMRKQAEKAFKKIAEG